MSELIDNHEVRISAHDLNESIKPEYPIEIIYSPEDPKLPEVAALDSKLFGEHKSLPLEAFQEIIARGGYVLAHTEQGVLISEASLVLVANPEGDSPLERAQPVWLAYCDGAAVDTAYRGKGLQKELLKAREMIARESGKEASSASVRQRNLASIRSMLSAGYVMIADSPHYYGDSPEDARVVMLKDFEVGNPLHDLETATDLLDDSLKGIVPLNDVKSRIESGADIISLAVEQSDQVDGQYNLTVGHLLSNGYIGVSCNNIDVGDGDGEPSNAMTFVRVDSLPEQVAQMIDRRQREIGAIVS